MTVEMTVEFLHPLSEFGQGESRTIVTHSPDYWYEGICPKTGDRQSLPRTPLAKAIAQGLMQQLATTPTPPEGKMYGILLVEAADRTPYVLKAFSGLWQGRSVIAGWVPPIPGQDQLILAETLTLQTLAIIKQELITLEQLPERSHYQTQQQRFEDQLQQLSDRHRQQKQNRQQQRQAIQSNGTTASQMEQLQQLDEESRRDGIDRRQFKRQRDQILHPLKHAIDQADARIQTLKQQRKALSRQLQAQMHAHYSLTNFAGESLPLQQLKLSGALPTGTGDCCAPKLLHYAATHGLKPLAMAEFWWGANSPNGEKVQGAFYGACTDRCQPILGFLLSGASNPTTDSTCKAGIGSVKRSRESGVGSQEPGAEIQNLNPSRFFHPTSSTSLPLLYEDGALIAINKSAGLLSVPGRYHDSQDSVLSRLQHQLTDGDALLSVHRLDQDTSGILLLARDRSTATHLHQQFQQHQVQKEYEAVLAGIVMIEQGVIDLPLWSDPDNRPYQQVDWHQGKPSLTRFQVMASTSDTTRIVFFPLTGRTHQLRVHAADPQGLGIPILGDRLYSASRLADRLHLHARSLRFQHPHTREWIELQSTPPF
jgi:tRNA pseudouridine32 synthase/23S rRNA pseudouridine746 synthase